MKRLVKNGAFLELSELLDLTGTDNVAEVDVAPAQPVYDMSRLPRARPGYVRSGLANPHVGASLVRDSLSRETIIQFRAPGIPEDQLDVWLVASTCLVDSATMGNFSAGIVGVSLDDGQPVNQDEQAMLVDGYINTFGMELVAGQGQAISPAAIGNSAGNLPILLPRGARSVVRVASLSTGSITFVRFSFRFWLGPRFQTPPGKA